MTRQAIAPTVVVLLLVALGGYCLFHGNCTSPQEAASEKAKGKAAHLAEHAIKEFVAKHNAVQIARKDIEFGCTLGFQEMCIRSDGRPVAIDCLLEDVIRDGDAYVAIFWSPAADNLVMRFKCSAERAHSLARAGTYVSGIVVGHVKVVKSAVIGLQVGDDRESVEVGPMGDLGCKVLSGELVDFLPEEGGL